MADPGILLDSSALLALLLREPGAESVVGLLDRAAISAVNLAEVIEVATRRGLAPARAAAWPGELGVAVLDFDAGMAAAAAGLLTAWRSAGLSLGDCACLATARRRGLPVLTADRAWATLDLGVEVRLIR
jgi:PIN domain nuclease of toxin-antitoxin system